MSGVFGCLDPDRSDLSCRAARRMAESLRHRPYHETSVACVEGVGAIGLHSHGGPAQTTSAALGPDGPQILVCGEFHHQTSQRDALVREGRLPPLSDAAALARAIYVRGGVEALTSLQGAFLVAVWDPGLSALFLVNDRFGLYPHYLAHRGSAIAFAPELRPLLDAPFVGHGLDRTAMAQYIRYQQILGDRTWLEQVSLLPPASILRFDPKEGSLHLRRYWTWGRIATEPAIGFDDAVEEASRRFGRAVRAAAVDGGHRIGLPLTGGLDSRTILAFTDADAPLQTMTYGETGCRDVYYARKLAAATGRPHRWFPLKGPEWIREHAALHLTLTSGFHSWMHAHGISTLESLRADVDVVLSGWDGGTVLGGFIVYEDAARDDWFRHAPSDGELCERLRIAFTELVTWPGLTDGEAARIFGGRGDAALDALAAESFREEFDRTASYPADRRSDFFYLDQHVRRSTQNMIVFSRSSVTVRCPYFDYGFVDFMYSLPPGIRTSQWLRRAMLTRQAPHLARIPRERDLRVPHESRWRYYGSDLAVRGRAWLNRRVGPVFPDRPRLYVDYETHLRNGLREWAEHLLFGPELEAAHLVDREALRALWERHLGGRELWTIGKVAPLMTLALVLRTLTGDRTATA